MRESVRPARLAARSAPSSRPFQRSRSSHATMVPSRRRNHAEMPLRRVRSSGVAPPRSASSSAAARRSLATSMSTGSCSAERVRLRLLERTQRLAERRFERPLDRHHLAGGLHLRAQPPVGLGELVERPARDLDDAVVECRLEGRTGFAGHGVGNLVEPAAGRDLGGDPRDGVPGGLGRERRRARHAGVDLDDVVLVRIRCERKLHVATTLDLERVDDAKRGAAQLLMLAIRQRLRGSDDHRIAGVHAHRDRGFPCCRP